MRNYKFSENDMRIIKKALRQRMSDLTKFADECDRKNEKTVANTFLEMCNDTQDILDKIYDQEDIKHD